VNILTAGYLDTNISVRYGNRLTVRQIYLKKKKKTKSCLTPLVFLESVEILVKVIFIFIF
jgi:hypothetical protein